MVSGQARDDKGASLRLNGRVEFANHQSQKAAMWGESDGRLADLGETNAGQLLHNYLRNS